MDRRHFLKLLGTLSLASLGPRDLAWATGPEGFRGDRILVLIELNGGNDGLNTLVPYTDPAYAGLRPQLAIPRDQVVALSPSLGMHPALAPLHPLWKRGHLAWVRGVGYPDPNRSHFRSIDIWETGSESHQYLDEGWIARLFAGAPAAPDRIAESIVLGNDAGPLEGAAMRNIIMSNPGNLIAQAQRMERRARATENPALRHILKVRADIQRAADEIAARVRTARPVEADFPGGKLGRGLQGLTRILAAGIRVPVFKLSHGSFDTHAGQLGTHQRLLGELAQGLVALEGVLRKLGLWERTLVMTYSEFGRRPAQNASGGTDHGTAAPHLLLGGRVRGGLHGHQPSLTDLAAGDLKHHVHFRDLYATVARRWWGLPGDPPGAAGGRVMDLLA